MPEQCLLIISSENAASFQKASKFFYDRDNQYSIGFFHKLKVLHIFVFQCDNIEIHIYTMFERRSLLEFHFIMPKDIFPILSSHTLTWYGMMLNSFHGSVFAFWCILDIVQVPQARSHVVTKHSDASLGKLWELLSSWSLLYVSPHEIKDS